MGKLNIRVENGATVVTIDGEEVGGLTRFKLFCEGNNDGDDMARMRFNGTPFGAIIESAKAELELEIDDVLATALKG